MCIFSRHPNKSWQLSFRLSFSSFPHSFIHSQWCLRRRLFFCSITLLPACLPSSCFALLNNKFLVSAVDIYFLFSNKGWAFFINFFLQNFPISTPWLPSSTSWNFFAANGKQFNIHIIQCHLKVLKKMGECLTYSASLF